MATTTTTLAPLPINSRGINSASGYYGVNWIRNSGVFPQSFSMGGWTAQNRGFVQQTFLGASIRSFTMNGGFGDSSSTLSIELVNDEYNLSDETPAGFGDDVYHSGCRNCSDGRPSGDKFCPPMVGSPVYFKFGQNFATVEEAYKQTFDDTYNMITSGAPISLPVAANYVELGTDTFGDVIDRIPTLSNGQYVDTNTGSVVDLNAYLTDTNIRGRYHMVFGGILQSYVQNRGPGGNPLYSVQVIDPREILSNVTLILNNYAGTTYNTANILNIYGFLEYNVSDATKNSIKSGTSARTGFNGQPLPYEIKLERFTHINDVSNPNQVVISYSGNDTYSPVPLGGAPLPFLPNGSFPNGFPITGTGFSRRSDQGIPFYRIKQAVNALLEYEGPLPQEYINKGFAGKINFRGFNYVVDFGSLPELPGLYYLDFDQINLLDLALEICDVASKDLFVSLLPVIDHPACKSLYDFNVSLNSSNLFSASGIAGIIRLDAIDRSKAPAYGAIKTYIDSLATSGIYVENQDVGYELSNITTDKFIIGAQQVENYFFTTNLDRDTNVAIAKRDKWTLETSFNQQLLPYYGLLGKNAVTIPKGFGSYQQILLDSTGLEANGVGTYYVATEMELRCAAISFERWKEFLLQYNDSYITSVEVNDAEEGGYLLRATAPEGMQPVKEISNNYAVTVPRSLWPTYSLKEFGDDKLPFSPCNPPYGYPLYYKRATKIGIPEAGLTSIASRITSVINNFNLLSSADKSNYKQILNSEVQRLRSLRDFGEMSEFEKNYFTKIEEALKNPDINESIEKAVFFIEQFLKSSAPILNSLGKIAKKNTENALKVYNFVKNIADECLGKKFLVKIPKATNLFYNKNILPILAPNAGPTAFTEGPFGFRPRPLTSIVGYEFTSLFKQEVNTQKSTLNGLGLESTYYLRTHLNSGCPEYFTGALQCNYNPIADINEFNYVPMNDGGFFDFDMYSNFISASSINTLPEAIKPLGLSQTLIPVDLTKFINQNGRVSPYVRFDHSQFLSLENLNPDDFTQQIRTANGFIVDFNSTLDNVKDTGTIPFTFQNFGTSIEGPDRVAFVKCSVDEKFYLPPKCFISGVQTAGQVYEAKTTFIPPSRIYDPCEDKYNDSFSYYQTVFIPKSDPGEIVGVLTFDCDKPSDDALNLFQSNLIKTNLKDLDTNNVYALITLPGRVIPTKDGRYRDSVFQALNAEQFKRYLLMDTVDIEVPGFNKPEFLEKAPTQLWDVIDRAANGLPTKKDVDAVNKAWFASRKALKNLSFAFPNQVNFAMPSPVYPDLISLPLMSKERCYGPWVSSQLDIQSIVYSNIGGRPEFIKDENLAPWNYDGYYLMNEAALTQAEFAHSLLLFSERGGFVVPGFPPNVSLGKSLLNLGPLVTNLQVDVSEAGVRSTIKMDLYTANFGKLQKQKQDEISKLSRERQKLKDERNALIRKGLGKAQASTNYGKDYETLNNRSESALVTNRGDIFSGTNNSLGTMVMGVQKDPQLHWSSNAGVGEHIYNQYSHEGTIQKQGDIGRVAQEFISQDDMARSYFNTAASQLSDMYSPASLAPDHPNMPSQQYVNSDRARLDLYVSNLT